LIPTIRSRGSRAQISSPPALRTTGNTRGRPARAWTRRLVAVFRATKSASQSIQRKRELRVNCTFTSDASGPKLERLYRHL
jgi:hypothetical protein